MCDQKNHWSRRDTGELHAGRWAVATVDEHEKGNPQQAALLIYWNPALVESQTTSYEADSAVLISWFACFVAFLPSALASAFGLSS